MTDVSASIDGMTSKIANDFADAKDRYLEAALADPNTHYLFEQGLLIFEQYPVQLDPLDGDPEGTFRFITQFRLRMKTPEEVEAEKTRGEELARQGLSDLQDLADDFGEDIAMGNIIPE